jgi:heme/copper-type cytochrome/quinol oxidase subunit 2
MPDILSNLIAKGAHIGKLALDTTTEIATDATSEEKLDKLFKSTEKAAELSSQIMDIVYILAAMIVVVAIFTITLYIWKFFKNRRDPNYVKNDDTFLDD